MNQEIESQTVTIEQVRRPTGTPQEIMKNVKAALVDLAKRTDETKNSKELLDYLAFSARASIRRYSLNNTWLIYIQKREATYVRGFKQWLSEGRHVRKGERGILILAPLTKTITRKVKVPKTDDKGEIVKDPLTGETLYEEKEEREQVITWFKPVYVFDISQTEGTPIAILEIVKVSEHEKATEILARLSDLAKRQGYVIKYKEMQQGHYGQASANKVITLSLSMTETQKIAVILHEYAHERLHFKDQKITHSQAETEAEAVAYVVCKVLGINLNSETYLAIHNKDTEQIIKAYERIQTVVKEILDSFEA